MLVRLKKFMSVRQADICPLACVSICILIKTPTSLKHLKSFDECRKSCNDHCFKVLDTASTYQPKIKEALHILLERPILNKKLNILIFP